MTSFEIPADTTPPSRHVASDIAAIRDAVRDAQARCAAMDLPSPGTWDAARCDAAYRRGYGAFERGDYAQAIECFAPLLSACPHQADYAVALALCAQRLGEPRAALPLFMAAALIDREAPGPMYRVGECLFELAYYAAAGSAMCETMRRCAGQPGFAAVRRAAQRVMAMAQAMA